MKKILICLLCAVATATAYAQNLTQAEKLYQEGDFASALPKYQEIIKTATGDTLLQAQLRAAACQYSLGEYLNAAKTLFGYELPKNPLWRARFLLYRTQLAKQVADGYYEILQQREVEDNPDMEQWTRQEWHRQIEQDYEALWALRAELIKAPVEAQTLIIDVKDTDTRRIPTLFDFAAQQWIQFLEEAEIHLPQKTENASSGKNAPAENRARQVEHILKTAYTLAGTGRQNARIFWQTDFILLPFEHNRLFDSTPQEAALKQAVRELNQLSGYSGKKLKKRSNPAADYGKSYAAYKTAQLLYQHDQRAEALAVCEYAAEQLETSYYTHECKNLAQQITAKEISLEEVSGALRPDKPVLSVRTRNVPTVYVRIYPVTTDELKKGYYSSNDLEYLRYLSDEQIKKLLGSSKKYQTAQTNVTYPKTYFSTTTPLALSALETGFYAVLVSYDASFNTDTAAVNGQLINITDLALFATTAIDANAQDYVWTLHSTPRRVSPNIFHFYTVNLKTGQAEPNVDLTVSYPWENNQVFHKKTDMKGAAHQAYSFELNGKSEHLQANVLAQKASNTAFISNLYFNWAAQTPVKLFLQTDRAVYRPGQKVQLSVQGFEKTVRGFEVLSGKDVQITVRGANGKQIFQASATLSDFGTAQLDFTLPQEDSLLGTFSMQATSRIGQQTYRAYHSFDVEEYKRPEYEIELQEPAAALAFGKKGTVKGQARYYTGNALQGATVKYSVTRRPYVPPFYWWRIFDVGTPEEIAQGETKTNDKGEFTVSFTPQQKEQTAAQYTVTAEVYDETGRAIETTRTYRVNQYPQLFKVDFAQGFYDENTPAPLVDITLTNADGKAITGRVQTHIYRVEDTPKETGNSLDAYYQEAPDKGRVFSRTLDVKQPGPQTLHLPALPEGIYRLKLQADDAEEQAIVFVVAAKKSRLNLPPVTLAQHTTYYPGQTARILAGAGKLTGSKRLEVFAQNSFLRKSELLPGGVSIYEWPVTVQNRGGVAFAWFGASGYRFFNGSATVTVPFDNQVLTVQPDVPEAVKPGQAVTWKLTARNAQNTPVNGQASLTVYDKSLDYYAKKENPFTLASFFNQTARPANMATSRLQVYSNTVFNGEDGTTTSYWNERPQLPTLNLVMQRRYYRGVGLVRGAMAKSAAPMMAMAARGTNSVAEEAMLDTAASYGIDELSRDAKEVAAEPADTPENIRTDFAETAYFNTQIPVKNGAARVRFTLPQSVTTWNVLGYVLTKNTELGTFALSTLARKDFMVRLHLPRFYRENDTGMLQASVTNTSDRKITVPVTISVLQNKQQKAGAFGITERTQTVSVPPNSTRFVSWNITVPAEPGLYQITAAGRTATDSDGEQKELPVFPSRTRLLASAHAALQNGANTLQVTELDGVKDAQAELAVLSLQPSLALSVLHKMPNLLTSPYNDLISCLNRYVPLAIVHRFYTTYPELKEAVKKLPARSGLSAPWNETDPLRLMVVEQTPWLNIAQGNAQQNAAIVSLFVDSAVQKQLARERTRILKLQNGNGSFSWFAGGPEDTYLTLRALEAFSQAVRFGAEVPEAEVQKALAYIVPKIDKQLKDDKSGSVYNVSYALYAAYTLSAFPAQWAQVAQAKPYLKKWVDYADEQAKFMTPLGQTYAAAIYHRLGDDIKARAYLNKVLARMKYNALTGAYFAPEAQSWVWYQDTLTTQTATLKTLLEITPGSDKIDPMVQWLLFNKQVADWKNPTAAAQAVFALLDVMKTKGALRTPSTYQINWAGTQAKRTFEPLDWTENLQWVKQGEQLTPAAYTASVTKQSKTTDFASLNVIYTTAQANESPKGVLNISRDYFVRFTQDGVQKLRPVKNLDNIKVGDEVEVQLTITAESAFDYVLVTDPKPAGFESADLHSGWTWNPVSMYREVRDADTNYFIQRLPAGTVRMSYVLRPTLPGKFHANPAQVQSMYAPEYGAHSAGEEVHVAE